MNTYAYVLGNPVSNTDPLGLMGSRGNPAVHKPDHDYSWKVFRCLGDCTAQVMRDLRCNPAPGVRPSMPTQTGDVNTVGIGGIELGPITTVVSSVTNTTWNLTMPGHILHPGWVRRDVIFDGESTWVVNTGGGTGFNPLNLNTILAPVVWGGQNPTKGAANACGCN